MIETDDGGHLCDVSTVSTGFSDHCLLKARLNCGRERTPVTRYSYRDIKNMDVDSFRAYLRSSVSFANPPTDPDDIVIQLEDDLHNALETYAPLRSKRRRVGRSRVPWLTPECITAKRKRRRLERWLKRILDRKVTVSPIDARVEKPAVCSGKLDQPTHVTNSSNSVTTQGNCGVQ